MLIRSLLFVIIGLISNSLAYGAACPASTTSTSTGSAFGSDCTVTGSSSTIQLNFKNGFSDATVVAASGGNNGTSIGAQRKLSFIKAAEILADQVASSQAILVDADFSGLSCNASSATLGSAGAATNTGNVTPMPAGAVINTFYPIGLINSLGNTDYAVGVSDITAQFNSNIGNVGCLQASNGWYYGFDAPASNYIGFTTVLLHEITHGLGFASLVDASTGAKPSGLDDAFSNNLYSLADGAAWSVAGGLSNAQRASSAISDTGLLWNGANVNAQAVGELTAGFHDADSSSSFTSGDRVQMYAPNPVESGSSVSHFNTAASPNEIMEPEYTAGQLDLGLALYLLKDIGWSVVTNVAPTITAVNQSTNEDTAKIIDVSSWGNDTDGDSLTYSVTSCPANISCSVSGTDVTLTPSANHNGGTHTVTIEVNDGNGETADDTFNLNVIAQNDDPVINGVPNQTVTVGEYKDIVLSGYASDVDGDGLTYSATSCGANLTCTFPNSTTIRVAAGGGVSSTVSVTVEADDSHGGTNTDTFDVSITAAAVVNNAPTISAVNQSTNEDTTKIVDASSWGSDSNGDTLTYSVNSACATNITCSINSNGTSLTMTPSANHNGGSHTITVSVDDGNGESASDSFNLNVIPQNDSPSISSIPNQTISVGEFKEISLTTYSSDIDGDALSYSVVTCGAHLTCSFPNSSTVRIAAGAGSGSTVSVTVQVDDGNGGTNTDTFTVAITSSVASTTVGVNGVSYADGDSIYLPLNVSQLNVDNGSGNYSYSLSYLGNDVSSLVTANEAGLEIGLPESGEFAGEYTLTITDSSDDVITVILKRPVRLNWSAQSILNGDTSQVLKIEGGAVGTVYSFVQSGSADVIFRNDDNASIITVTALNDVQSFNAAKVKLDSSTVSNISTTDVTVQSTYDDVIETGIKVYPSSMHNFSVKNLLNEPLENAEATLNGNETLLTELNISKSYTTNSVGEFSVLLPDTSALSAGSHFDMQISLSGYNSESLELNSENTTHAIVLSAVENGITLLGSISAKGNQNFLQSQPQVVLYFMDDTQQDISVSVTSSTQASFNHDVDLNVKSLRQLSVVQAESVTVNLDVSNITQTQNIDIFLLNNGAVAVTTPVPVDQPIDTTSSKPSLGSLFGLTIALFFLLQAASLGGRRKIIDN